MKPTISNIKAVNGKEVTMTQAEVDAHQAESDINYDAQIIEELAETNKNILYDLKQVWLDKEETSRLITDTSPEAMALKGEIKRQKS